MTRRSKDDKFKRKNYHFKTGALSNNEIAYIRTEGRRKSPEQVSKTLNRPVETVRKHMAKVLGIKEFDVLSVSAILEGRPEWKSFEKQFTPEELEDFKHQYVQLMGVFKDDIMPTEEIQVFQLISLKIQIDRVFIEQKMALQDMASAHSLIEDCTDALKIDPQDQDAREALMMAEAKYESAKRTNKECADRYKIYSDKQDKMLVSLKATRDQRVKVWENSKQSFLGFLRLLTEEDQREKMGLEMEMMRAAADKEEARLRLPHVYDDGTEDQPLLTPEGIHEHEEEGA